MREEELFNQNEVDKLINSAFDDGVNDASQTELRRKFDQRLKELDVSFNQAEENLEIGYRALNGILDGGLERDLLSLLKIASFLDLPNKEVLKMCVNAVAQKYKNEIAQAHRRVFILKHFDLPALRSMDVIDSIRDFDHIEQRLTDILGLKSITDYDTGEDGAAYCSGKTIAKSARSREYFKSKARAIFKTINNPHAYDRDALVEYFPKIRWHSIDSETGMVNVMKALYKLGVTVIFQQRTPALRLRGATFPVNRKPCIVLTDYKGFYPTLWFALLHELFHVLFDWDEIVAKRYHLSDEEDDLDVLRHKEEEANDFAREFMFPKKKMEIASDHIAQRLFIKEFALDNHVHPSIIYANYAYENSVEHESLWAQFQKHMPQIKTLVKTLTGGLGHKAKASEFADYYKTSIFNEK